ncbi:hypothetical protein EV122DRAFT_210983 [Schizophyllum commune]
MDVLRGASVRAILNDWVLAVLKDWDIATDVDSSNYPALLLPRPSNITFTAVDLLANTTLTQCANTSLPQYPNAFRYQTPHLYRHDLESFFYVLVWVVCCYDSGRRVKVWPERLAALVLGGITVSTYSSDLEACAASKNAFLHFGWRDLVPTASWRDLAPNVSWGMLAFKITDALLSYFRNFLLAANGRASRWASERASRWASERTEAMLWAAILGGDEPTTLEKELNELEEVWKGFREVVERAVGRTVERAVYTASN